MHPTGRPQPPIIPGSPTAAAGAPASGEGRRVPELTRRRATRADCPLLGRLNLELIQDEGHRNAMTELELARRMKFWLGRGGYTALLFETGGEVAAYALYHESPNEIYLRHLYVARTRRRQGIGRQVMRTLTDDVWPRGKRLIVEVLWTNHAAIAFWKAVGYREYSLCLEIMPTG